MVFEWHDFGLIGDCIAKSCWLSLGLHRKDSRLDFGSDSKNSGMGGRNFPWRQSYWVLISHYLGTLAVGLDFEIGPLERNFAGFEYKRVVGVGAWEL